MSKASEFVYTPFRVIIIAISSLIVTVLYWLVSIVAIPLYIFRKTSAFFARLLDSDVCQMVNTTGNIITRDYDNWSKSVCHAITVLIIVNGSPSIHEIRELFLKKLVHKKDANYDKLEYPELQQRFAKRFGYLFLKWDRNFDICNHINVFSNKKLLPNGESDIVNEATLMRIWETVSTKPLSQNRSPWDVHLAPNYFPDKNSKLGSVNIPEEMQTAIFLRVHHGLSDGFGVYKILLSLTDDGITKLENDIPVYRKAPPYMNLLINLKAFFCGPVGLVKKASLGFDIYNPLHRPLRENTGQVHIFTETIDLETIKKITQLHSGVSFHAVLLAAITGGIRNFLIGNGHKITRWPIRLGLPLPKPGHTQKLRNDFFCTLVDLPVHKNTARQRLLLLDKRLRRIPNESFFPFMAQTWNILGLSPSNISTTLTLKSAVTVMYSEIKGPSKEFTILDGKCRFLDLKYSFGLGADDLGVGFASLSYNGRLYIVLCVDHAIAPKKSKAQELMNLIMKEIEELHYGDTNNL